MKKNYDLQKGEKTLKNLNQLLEDVGINFDVLEGNHDKKLIININEEILRAFKKKMQRWVDL